MKKKYKIIGIILIVWAVILITDFTLAKLNKRPLFVIIGSIYKDGGTKEYYGLGYKVIKYNRLDTIDDECLNHYYEYIGYNGEAQKPDISKSGCIKAGRTDAVFGTWFLKVK